VRHLLARFRLASIRDPLLLAFLLIVLIPAVAFGAISGAVGLRCGRQQVIDKLESVAVLKEAELTAWARNVQTDLATVAIGPGIEHNIQILLSSSSNSEACEAAYQQIHEYFDRFVVETERFNELLVLDAKRRAGLT
jgi:hypothetical protein